MTLPRDVTDVLGEYSVGGSLADDGRIQLSLSHDRCVWHKEKFVGISLAELNSLAFEHRITGCSMRARLDR